MEHIKLGADSQPQKDSIQPKKGGTKSIFYSSINKMYINKFNGVCNTYDETVQRVIFDLTIVSF